VASGGALHDKATTRRSTCPLHDRLTNGTGVCRKRTTCAIALVGGRDVGPLPKMWLVLHGHHAMRIMMHTQDVRKRSTSPCGHTVRLRDNGQRSESSLTPFYNYATRSWSNRSTCTVLRLAMSLSFCSERSGTARSTIRRFLCHLTRYENTVAQNNRVSNQNKQTRYVQRSTHGGHCGTHKPTNHQCCVSRQ